MASLDNPRMEFTGKEKQMNNFIKNLAEPKNVYISATEINA